MSKCSHCQLERTPEDHDGCLGVLHGLMNACCGHGGIREPYVQFIDGSCICGEDAAIIQNILIRNRNKIKVDRNIYFMKNGERMGIQKVNKLLKQIGL